MIATGIGVFFKSKSTTKLYWKITSGNTWTAKLNFIKAKRKLKYHKEEEVKKGNGVRRYKNIVIMIKVRVGNSHRTINKNLKNKIKENVWPVKYLW